MSAGRFFEKGLESRGSGQPEYLVVPTVTEIFDKALEVGQRRGVPRGHHVERVCMCVCLLLSRVRIPI